jgi:hypothetical protein
MVKGMQQYCVCEEYNPQKQDPISFLGRAQIVFQQLPQRDRKARFF